MQTLSPHSFHIPVMGLAFSIDSPIKVACYGISSTMSIIEDNLIETMRKHYYRENNEEYIPITTKEPDYRARRISDYLNLVQRIVSSKIEKLKNSAIEAGSELSKYFEMLPDDSILKEKYLNLLSSEDEQEQEQLLSSLKKNIVPGAIEVNVMTKVDKDNTDSEGLPIENGSDALISLKAYAESELDNSAIIFSAGMNPRLYNYLENFSEFDASGWGEFKKRVIIKVSDYRSALIQGKYLAKKGIWVSEFRIESGLNCGGHVFATQGLLLGPILKEFNENREELSESLFSLYSAALEQKDKPGFLSPHPIRITVQGGIGTFEEDALLREHYGMDGTGWGTPFLLCPEATTVDDQTMEILLASGEKDVIRSKSSPLGVGFNYLKETTGEIERLKRIENKVPGSPCTEKFLVSNTEFTKTPICTASRKYQKKKIAQLSDLNLSEAEYNRQMDEVLSKECLCVGLSNSASLKYQAPFLKKQHAVTICPGPNIVNFNKKVSLKEMTDHIYGRTTLLATKDRPHFFMKELQLYLDFFKEQLEEVTTPDKRKIREWNNFLKNLKNGIAYYHSLVKEKVVSNENNFRKTLKLAEVEIHRMQEQIQRCSLQLT
ncbi:hypothetical protein [Christiangramia forsetii]|uniref:Uncharacterized protein n=2 Tax=Christiangramia forsetii TaxID=411153 RepID=A0M184_CHRFK|nr:hypothetical protein [Christiangramia forsetii]GGG43126.1 hypothetical protein GCM10011532_28850 [Christiangramia forsetii]CAL66379.1 hypothetical protein GFO_1405 [Christiangramia forsetii KT0803]